VVGNRSFVKDIVPELGLIISDEDRDKQVACQGLPALPLSKVAALFIALRQRVTRGSWLPGLFLELIVSMSEKTQRDDVILSSEMRDQGDQPRILEIPINPSYPSMFGRRVLELGSVGRIGNY
jgi:hypothetical protein